MDDIIEWKLKKSAINIVILKRPPWHRTTAPPHCGESVGLGRRFT